MFMRNKRTGRIVVYDEKLLELGYEVVEENQPAPKVKKPTDDEVSVKDEITVRLIKKGSK